MYLLILPVIVGYSVNNIQALPQAQKSDDLYWKLDDLVNTVSDDSTKSKIISAFSDITKKASSEFDKLYHQLEGVLKQLTATTGASVEMTQLSPEVMNNECNCYCRCPHTKVNSKVIDDLKYKVMDLTDRFSHKLDENPNYEKTEDPRAMHDQITIHSNLVARQYHNTNEIVSWLDILKGKKITHLRKKRSPMEHCSCSGKTDVQKQFEELKAISDKMDELINKIEQSVKRGINKISFAIKRSVTELHHLFASASKPESNDRLRLR